MIAQIVKTHMALAQALGVSRRTVIEWTQRPGFPKLPEGGYDVDEVRAWHLDNVAPNDTSNSAPDIGDLKEQLMRAELDKKLAETRKIKQEEIAKEMKNRQIAGELVRADDQIAQWAEFLASAKAIIESFPDDLAKEMPEESRVPARSLADHKVTLLLRKLASWQPEGTDESDDDTDASLEGA